ncbi:MAG: AAA family ATPase [Sulfurovum sp.]
MSAEIAHFQNFAKLKDTSLAFNDITVLAGKPSTGKSYVMKFMYAVDEADNLSNNKTKNNNLEYASILNNLLNSIFLNCNQISSNFTCKYKNLSIKIAEDDHTINFNYKEFRNIENKIFVETPLILEFKKFMKREKGKTPYHIESLLNILDTDYSFTDEEQDKFIKDFREKSKAIIGGDIESSGDSFIFNKEGDQNYDILNASSGTKSIGLLQYLVTNKALKKGSVLYWEEPEVHLHPEWQLKMVELFIELMNAGVKIVFSTHSTFMADSLNALSKKEGFTDRVSFNLFKENNGVVENHILDTDKKWKLIQDELLKSSLEEIMWQYL